jgi:hypothetical protein
MRGHRAGASEGRKEEGGGIAQDDRNSAHRRRTGLGGSSRGESDQRIGAKEGEDASCL